MNLQKYRFAIKLLSPTPLEQIYFELKACKSYDLQAFLFYKFFKLFRKSLQN